jgi:hypothetical protein
MLTIKTQQGKEIEILLQAELDDFIDAGDHVRAYCHLHGSDHQRSLSIDKASGWGHCFNAACDAIVLVADWNLPLARHLIQTHYQGMTARTPIYTTHHQTRQVAHTVVQHTPHVASTWQHDELTMLLSMQEYMRAGLLHTQRAQAYLEQRKIPLELAQATGVGYLPATIPDTVLASSKPRRLLHRWTERLIFPLSSPSGKGYIGRSVWGWKAGMDENIHKALLEEEHAPKRWIKTNPAGWFGFDPEQHPSSIILVEGAFDRLTLLAAGFQATEVAALVGTAAQPSWFP